MVGLYEVGWSVYNFAFQSDRTILQGFFVFQAKNDGEVAGRAGAAAGAKISERRLLGNV